MWAERRIFVIPGGTYSDHWALKELTGITFNYFNNSDNNLST